MHTTPNPCSFTAVWKPNSTSIDSGECIRLKNFVINSEITENEIYNCGVYDFQGDGEGVNGEGIYIGTSFTQVSRRGRATRI